MFPTPAIDITRVTRQKGMDGHARWHTRVRGTARDARRAAVGGARRGDGDARRGADPRARQLRGQSGAVDPERQATRRGVAGPRVPGRDRSLRERDHAARRPDPAAGVDARGGALRSASSRSSRCATRCAGRRRWSSRARTRCTTGRSCSASRSDSAAGRRESRRSTRCVRGAERLGFAWNPASTIDLLLRTGPHGDRFLPWSKGLSLKKLKRAEHGLDLGPLEPGVARRVFHGDRKVHLAAEPFLRNWDALDASLAAPPPPDTLVLIGRRELRTNNSWMHNVPSLVSGAERCLLFVHPKDAAQRGIADGETVVMESRVHRGERARAAHRGHRSRRREPPARLGPRGERAVAARRGPASRASRPTTGPTSRSSRASSGSRS